MIKDFYVIAVCSNPVRYQARYRLYHAFIKHMHDLGAQVLQVEQAFGHRPFVVTKRDDPMHLQFRTDQELWHKENMINRGIEYLSQVRPDWQYVAWVDADIIFQRRDVLEETVHQLQHYDVVQMWSNAVDMGPQGQHITTHTSFMHNYVEGGCVPPTSHKGNYYGVSTNTFWHPGYAWAARRTSLNRLKLFDKGILGAGDHHMAMSLVGRADLAMPRGVSEGYRNAVLQWGRMAELNVRRNVGYVPGLITHNWHGAKAKRKYAERWDILTSTQFDPNIHLALDAQGLYRLNDLGDETSLKLRDQIRAYFRQRDEDNNSYEE